MPDEEADRVPGEYEAHIRALVPPLPPAAQRLIREVSLHDGLLRTLSGDAKGLEWITFVRATNRQVTLMLDSPTGVLSSALEG